MEETSATLACCLRQSGRDGTGPLFQVAILPLEVLNLLAGGISDHIPGETLFTRFHGLFGPGIEDTRLDPFPPAEVLATSKSGTLS